MLAIKRGNLQRNFLREFIQYLVLLPRKHIHSYIQSHIYIIHKFGALWCFHELLLLDVQREGRE